MRGKTVRFVNLMENERGYSVLSFDHIVHEKLLAFMQQKAIMKKVKIVKLIVTLLALIYRGFNAFFDRN